MVTTRTLISACQQVDCQAGVRGVAAVYARFEAVDLAGASGVTRPAARRVGACRGPEAHEG